ncbi:MAG TPA: hypothetical protein VF443_03440, partial [Nitrospira sp.]
MKQMAWGAIVLGSLVWLGGCAGKGEEVPMNVGITPAATSTGVAPVSSVKVVVIPFQDDRSDRTKLGTHHSLWGSDQVYTVKSG